MSIPARDTTAERDVYTPSRLNREARLLLEYGLPTLWLTGELSNLSKPASGHWYFSLKDASAQLRSAMFRQRNLLTRFVPKDGMHVLVRGRVSLYEPRGDYQFIVEHMEEAGEGALRRQFEELKAKLAAAGLFALDRKRALPPRPRRIGVITSPTGAAVRDILHVLKRRFPLLPVRIYPVAVQGVQATSQIAAAIALASHRRDCDVLILARGGGSLEDLWAFNEALVAYAIFESNVPIVTGIGHEVDFTIADFVADARAPTPSAAAEMVAPDSNEWLRQLQASEKRITACTRQAVNRYRERLNHSQRRLAQLHPGSLLRQQAQRVDELDRRLRNATLRQLQSIRACIGERAAQLQQHSPALRLSAMRGRLGAADLQLRSHVRRNLEQVQSRFKIALRTLHTISPLATLQRGYAIATDRDGSVITASSAVAVGDNVEIRLRDGRLGSQITWIQAEAEK